MFSEVIVSFDGHDNISISVSFSFVVFSSKSNQNIRLLDKIMDLSYLVYQIIEISKLN